jgi:hypothetical protein
MSRSAHSHGFVEDASYAEIMKYLQCASISSWVFGRSHCFIVHQGILVVSDHVVARISTLLRRLTGVVTCHLTRRMSLSSLTDTRPVAWQWGSGKPGGTASEVATEGELTMETKNGNEVKKKADPENPAVRVERSGHDVVKRASELEVEEKGDNHKEGSKDDEKKDAEAEKKDDEAEEKKDDEEEKNDDKENGDDIEEETNGDAQAGDKRKAEDDAEEKSDDKAADKKADKAEKPKENGDKPPPKKKGRPAKNANGPKADKPKKEPKKAATETGEPRRSGRNR